MRHPEAFSAISGRAPKRLPVQKRNVPLFYTQTNAYTSVFKQPHAFFTRE